MICLEVWPKIMHKRNPRRIAFQGPRMKKQQKKPYNQRRQIYQFHPVKSSDKSFKPIEIKADRLAVIPHAASAAGRFVRLACSYVERLHCLSLDQTSEMN